jgi:DNA polymerase IV
MKDRLKHIAHLDLDCFFVSVERIKDPALCGKPVAVGGSPQGRGVVASASYEARAFGVRSAMSAAKALRLCPHLIMVRGRHHEYGEYSDRLYERLTQLAPIVERASIDEFYLDLTGCEGLYNNDLPGFIRTLKQLVMTELQLPCSIALATGKTLAKIAVGTVKPSGVCVVPAGEERAFLAPLPVGVIPGVGAKTEERLHSRGIRTVADLQRLSREQATALLGVHGNWLLDVACGGGSDELVTDWVRKSISREETFSKDLQKTADIEREMFALVEDVCATLRGKAWNTQTIQVKIRYHDFSTHSSARTIEPTNDDTVVYRTARELLRTLHDGRPIRLIGVHLSNFSAGEQLELQFSERDSNRERMLKAVDDLRAKFGDGVIHVGNA